MLADRVVIMKDGQVVDSGTPEEILVKEELLKDCGLDIPMTVKLSQLLIEEGILDALYVNQEDLVNALWAYNLNK